ncbi:MAG: S-layer homology domain-containing protein [Solibacillus sp.]
MFNRFKKITISFIAVILVCSQLLFAVGTSLPTVQASEGNTLRIDLKDKIQTKSNRFTFDIWAKDIHDKKIENKYVTVTNNGKDVGINWSDEVKTSYTVYLDEGINNLYILVNYEDQILERSIEVEYKKAAIGEVIGEFTFSMDAFVAGMDYLIEPIKVPIINGENGAHHLERILANYNFTSDYTGSVDSGYYLSVIQGGNLLEKEPSFPEALMDAFMNEWEKPDLDSYPFDPIGYGLGEFDFNYLSGWMYAVNNVFPNVGFADYYLMNDDIMRVQFTIAYGSDIGGGYAMGGSEDTQFFPRVNKDAITEIMATINSSSAKDILLNNAEVNVAYEHAFKTVRTVNISQAKLSEAEEQLRSAYEKAKIAALIELISTSDVANEDVLASILYDVNKLTADELDTVTNLENLDDQATAITTAIKALPAPENITIADEATVNEITANFEALNEQQQKLVRTSTVVTLTAAQEAVANLIEVNKAVAQPVIELIDALPAKENLTLADKAIVLDVQAAFEALTGTQQVGVTNAHILEEALLLLDELQIAFNNLTVTNVVDQINALTTADSVTLIDETSILAAQSAYDALDDKLKVDVTNAHFLDTLAQVLEELRDVAAQYKAEIQAVISLIEALPVVEKLALTDEANLVEAQNAFTTLTTEQQELVTNKQLLAPLTAKIAELKVARENETAAAKVDVAINALPATVALTDAAKIQEARTLFVALTLAQQALVANLTKLVAAESQLVFLNSTTDKPNTEDKENNGGGGNNSQSEDRDNDRDNREPASSNSSSGGSSSGGSSSAPTSTTKPVETPTTSATETETTNINTPVNTSNSVNTDTTAPIKTVTVNTAENTIDIAVEGNTSTMQLALTPAVVKEIKAQVAETVVIRNENNVAIEVPTALFTDILEGADVELKIEANREGRERGIKLVLEEKRTDGSKRAIELKNQYVKVKVPLTLFTAGPTASLTPIAQDSSGVILRVVDGEYKAVPHQIKNGEVSIYANSNDEYVYSTKVITFDDIAKLANKDDIEFLASRYVVNGTSDTTFEPNKSITRAQFGAMIARALNLTATEATHYADTKGKWYEADIQALYEAGITNSPGDFNPGTTLSREHAAAFMYRVMQYIQKDSTPKATAAVYADQAQINANYTEAIATLNALHIMQGKAGNVFDPKGHLTRAQMAKILRKTLEAIHMI